MNDATSTRPSPLNSSATGPGLAVVMLLALGIASCSDTSKDDAAGQADAGPATSNPIVPQIAAYPFPSDFYLETDSTTRTGRRVAIPQEALPDRVPSSIVADMDGFSRMPLIATYIEGGIDPQTLLALDDHAGSIAPQAPVMLIEEDTWQPIPILAESDLTAPRDEDRALLIRPLQLLDANTGYVVVVKNTVRNVAGAQPAPSAAFLALRDNIETDDVSIESQRDSFALVKQALQEAAISPGDVLQAWSFHTRSAEQVTSTLLTIQDQANVAEIGDYELTSDVVEDLEGGASNRQLRGTFKAPNFLDDEGLIARDDNGTPEQRGTRDVEFSVTIPSTIDGIRPVIIYGHGFFGTFDQATRGSVTDIGHEYRFSAAGTNIGFSADNESATIQSVTNLANFSKVVADVQQNIANQTSLARLLREHLAADIVQDLGNGPEPVLDPENVHYYGISNGGTFGFLATSTSPQFDRAALTVGGGGLIHFLERAVNWLEFSGIVNLAYPEARERQLTFSLIQMMLDPIDPVNYARHLVHDRYPGRKSMEALVVMAVNDSQVRNLVSEWVARTADLPLVLPSPKPIFGLRTASADGEGLDELGGFFVYDEQVTPSPLGNLPPAEDNDTHGTLRYVEAYRQQVGTFLDTGKRIQFCDGPCDPN